MKFRVSLAATEATLSSGRPLVCGEEVDLAPSERDDSFNARLIAEGKLISIVSPDKAAEEARQRKEGPK